MTTDFDSCCGLVCKDCALREENHCGGCIATEGHPFQGSCEIAECARGRNRRFCGECGDFPCETLKRFAFDPDRGDDGWRIDHCRAVKKALVARAREGVDPIGVCAHHCDHCFMGQWCGGCRSSYNCCSFATLFPDGICPNVRCAFGKGLEGCYACDQLESCTVGFYGNDNQHAAKATALYIRKYGKETYRQTLSQAIARGLAYAKDLDDTGSPEAALALLEEHMGGNE